MTKQLIKNPIPKFSMDQIQTALVELHDLNNQSNNQYSHLVRCAYAIGSNFNFQHSSMYCGDESFLLPPMATYLANTYPEKFFNLFDEGYEIDLQVDDDQYRDLVGYVLHEVLTIVKNQTPLNHTENHKVIWTTIECCSCYDMIKTRLIKFTSWNDPVCPSCAQ